MTTTPSQSATPADLRLGRDVVRRMRLPGPPLGRPLPSRIGSLASSVSRFAAATSRPIDVRRALVGPDPRGLAGSSAPPRWWTPVLADPVADSAAPATPAAAPATPAAPAWLAPARAVALRRLPDRGLPRAAREVPDEKSWTPGGILGGLRGEVARVRRLDEVAAVGPMLTQNDRAKLNAGLAARNARQGAAVPQATAQQAPARPSVARRATTRTPRQSAPAAGAAAEPPTPPGPTPTGPTPPGGASATLSSPGSVASSPPPVTTPATPAPPPTSGASATLSSPGSVASSPPGRSRAAASGTLDQSGTAGPATLRRTTRPSWQLRAHGSRFDGLVRRTPVGTAAAATSAGPPPATGLASIVSRLALPDRVRPAGAAPADAVRAPAAPGRTARPRPGLESAVRDPQPVAAAGPGLIAGGIDAPATVRRHSWSAGSLVMRQSAGAHAHVAATATARSTTARSTTARSTTAPDTTAPAAGGAASASSAGTVPRDDLVSSSPAPSHAAPSHAAPPNATPSSAPPANPAPPENLVRRLPSALGAGAGVAPASSEAPATATATRRGTPDATADTAPDTAPGSAPDLRRLPRLWRRATDVRPATDLRSSTPAPVVRLVSPLGTGAQTPTNQTPTGPTTTSQTMANQTSSVEAAAATGRPPPPAAPAPPAAAVRRSALPASRLGAHVATARIAGADLRMPELMTVRRASAYGTDASRTLATGFGAAQTIRPAGSPVSAPVAAVGGESRLWRSAAVQPGATGASSPSGLVPGRVPAAARRGSEIAGTPSGPTAPPVRRLPAGRRPWTGPTGPTGRSGPTWQPWRDAPGAPSPDRPSQQSPGAATFPTGPPGAASAPSGQQPTADVRRLTVAPPRISLAPHQPLAPPIPEVGRSATPPASTPAPQTVRRSPGGSLVEATAHLFATPDAPLVRRAAQPGGSPMSSLSPSPTSSSPPIRRQYEQGPDGGEMSGQTLSAAATDSLVDKVVERIERRVIEELERRGRSHGRGSF